jgi:hypothetical protein
MNSSGLPSFTLAGDGIFFSGQGARRDARGSVWCSSEGSKFAKDGTGGTEREMAASESAAAAPTPEALGVPAGTVLVAERYPWAG